MKYAKIKYFDTDNGIGVRTSLILFGCCHNCSGCFNQGSLDAIYDQELPPHLLNEIITSLNQNHVTGLSILGNEPLSPENREPVLQLIKTVRNHCFGKDIWLYTDYTFETLLQLSQKSTTINQILTQIDVLKDGIFIEELYDPLLQYRCSTNQRLIDVPHSRATNRTVLWQNQ